MKIVILDGYTENPGDLSWDGLAAFGELVVYDRTTDGLAYERLIKILSMYRLTLGQARQEELLEYLFKSCDDPEKLRSLFINLSPFYKSNPSTK